MERRGIFVCVCGGGGGGGGKAATIFVILFFFQFNVVREIVLTTEEIQAI